MSVKAIEALASLVAEQGKQIVELSKALAIAHEVYAGTPAPVSVAPPASGNPGKLYYSEDEEDELYASGDMPLEDTRQALEEIIASAGIPAPVSFTLS